MLVARMYLRVFICVSRRRIVKYGSDIRVGIVQGLARAILGGDGEEMFDGA